MRPATILANVDPDALARAIAESRRRHRAADRKLAEYRALAYQRRQVRHDFTHPDAAHDPYWEQR